MVVVDPGFTTDASSSAYLWNVTLEEGETGQASADVTDAALREDGVWYGESSVNLQYVPYVLGDVNSDGSVDTSDIFESMYYVARKAVAIPMSALPETHPLRRRNTHLPPQTWTRAA